MNNKRVSSKQQQTTTNKKRIKQIVSQTSCKTRSCKLTTNCRLSKSNSSQPTDSKLDSQQQHITQDILYYLSCLSGSEKLPREKESKKINQFYTNLLVCLTLPVWVTDYLSVSLACPACWLTHFFLLTSKSNNKWQEEKKRKKFE